MGMKAKSLHFSLAFAGGRSIKFGGNPFVSAGNKANKSKKPIFDKNGHVTFNSISARREFFLGKSVARLEHELNKYGYKTRRRPSVREGSKAKFIISLNSSKDRNVTQIQVSPGSKRHGNVAYVKISTSDIGKIKVVAGDSKAYKCDGKETARILFRRKK